MASYAMTIDERSTQGRALLTYLGTLDIKLQPLTRPVTPCQFTRDEMKTMLAESTDEARRGLGTSHEDFKREIAKPTEEQKARLRQAYRDSQEGSVFSQETAHQMMDEFAQEQYAVAV